MGEKYPTLHRGKIHLDYVRTNRDAGATRLDVFTVDNEKLQGGFMLCFLDDGDGMSPEEASDVIFFGMSKKRLATSRFIGYYGNGLKSGSMRIGKDFILFTKKEDSMTCIFLSQTFCESEGLNEVIVPIPSWSSKTKESITDPEKFSEELSVIYKYSPFKTEAELMQQFDKIYRKSGTLVVIYNLKLMLTGEPELDIKTNKEDILIAGVLEDLPERWSFRAYTSVLYFDPRMRIFIQTKKVQTKHLSYCLYRPRKYLFVTSSFKGASKNEVKKAEVAVKIAEQMVKEAQLKIKKSDRTGLHSAKDTLKKALEDAEVKQKILKEKQKELRKPRKFNLIFGVNIKDRSQDGMFIYSNSRLIKMHEKVGPQLRHGSLLGAGVVGIVNIPLEVMEPSHNKQGFFNIKEYNYLLKIMGLYLVQYWKDTGISNKNLMLFWNEFGYQSNKWLEKPLNSPRYKRRQALEIPFVIQCDLCLKWRVIPSSDDYKKRENLHNWICADNPNLSENSCDKPEQLPSFPLGTMNPMSASENEKEKQLRDSVQRYQNKLVEQQSQNSLFVAASKTTEFLLSSEASAPKGYAKFKSFAPQRDPSEGSACSSSGICSSPLSWKKRRLRTDSTSSHDLEAKIPEKIVRNKVKIKQRRRHLENSKFNENSQVSSWKAKKMSQQGSVEDSEIKNEDENSSSDPDLIMIEDENDIMTMKQEKEASVMNKGLVLAENKWKPCADNPEIKRNSSPLNFESLSSDDSSQCSSKKEGFLKEECNDAVSLVKPPQSTCVRETIGKLMAQLREILLYFHPHCKLPKDLDCNSVEELMTMCELENCPEQLNKKLQVCCDQIWNVYMVQYEKKVRKKMQSITQQANKTTMNNDIHRKQYEKQTKITENKLNSLRAKVATLLGNWNLSTSDDSDHIDNYIEALLNEENLFLPDTLKLVTRKSEQDLPSYEE